MEHFENKNNKENEHSESSLEHPKFSIMDIRDYLLALAETAARDKESAVDDETYELAQETEAWFRDRISLLIAYGKDTRNILELISKLEEKKSSYVNKKKIAQGFTETIEFIQGLGDTKSDLNRSFFEWRQARTEGRPLAEVRPFGGEGATPYIIDAALSQEEDGTTIKNPGENREVREAQLLLEVMSQGSGALCRSWPADFEVSAGASFFGGGKTSPGGGFWHVFDSRWGLDKDPREIVRIVGNDRRVLDEYLSQGVYEFVSVGSVEAPVLSEVEETVDEPRFLGVLSKKVSRRIQKVTGTRPILHNEVVSGGSDEPLASFNYNLETGNTQASNLYKDEMGRPGNILYMTLLLPESVARKLMDELSENPRFVRKLADEVMMRKLGISEKALRYGVEGSHGPLRPSYKEIDKLNDGNMKLCKVPYGEFCSQEFHPEWV